MKKIPLLAYLENNGFDYNRIIDSYIHILKMMHIFIKKHKLDGLVIVNGNKLIRAIVDCFVDFIRIKEFHPVNDTNKEKMIAYMAYWLLRRRPIQVLKDFDGDIFINEYFVTEFITSIILKERKIGNNEKKKNPSYISFYIMLYYNLCFRTVTQQSLELMIDAFFCGFDFNGEVKNA